MNVLKNLNPSTVFEYFEKICKIPHGSGNTKRISDFCVEFAISKGLKYKQDKWNNVIIEKPATCGYEQHQSVIIQGHLDMVCEKQADYEFDFENDELSIYVNDGYISANGTTLGADDGIAVAMALAVLEDDSLSHPKIYAIFTVDEETGMDGALNIDLSTVDSKILLNIDSEEESVLTVSCAGGARCSSQIPLNKVNNSRLFTYKIHVGGLKGGHSGVEIDKGRLNASVVVSHLLRYLSIKIDFNLIDIKGGLKDNAITRECMSKICTDCDFELIKKYIDEFKNSLNIKNDKDLFIDISFSNSEYMFDKLSSQNATDFLVSLPYGVVRMSKDIENLVETSVNFGKVLISDSKLVTSHSVRSSVNEQKENLIVKLNDLAQKHGGTYSVDGKYPAWEYKKSSPLRDKMIDIHNKLYGFKPKITSIHAGLECGLLCDKIDDLDAVSFGPEILDIHTPQEKMKIASVERTYKFLCTILKEI